jgi:hypothetical protein
LGGFVIAIGGIAVGVASTNAVPNSGQISDQAAAAPHASKAPAAPKFMPASSTRSQE